MEQGWTDMIDAPVGSDSGHVAPPQGMLLTLTGTLLGMLGLIVLVAWLAG